MQQPVSPDMLCSSIRLSVNFDQGPMRQCVLISLACLLLTPAVHAVDRPLPPKLDESIDRALAFISKQHHADGFFDQELRKEAGGANASGHSRAISGLCLLAFLSAGHTPDAGRYGPLVRKTTDALTAVVPEDGYVGKLDEKPMYTQAIVTVALAQAYGVEPVAEKRLREFVVLKRLISVILAAQDLKKDAASAGGWRYSREAPDSDLSLSGWNALALRAAQDAGVPVPEANLKRAADYVARCYAKEARGFAYQPGGAVQTGTTSTGVLCLYLLERQVRPEAQEAARTLPNLKLDPKATGGYPFYSMFYLTQAAAQAGDDVSKAVNVLTIDKLIANQGSDGGWPKNWPTESSEEPGRVYRASMAALTLTIPNRLLPIYQR